MISYFPSRTSIFSFFVVLGMEIHAQETEPKPLSPPRVTSARLVENQFQVSFSSMAGGSYSVLSSGDLTTDDWSEVATGIIALGEMSTWRDPSPLTEQQFYRVRRDNTPTAQVMAPWEFVTSSGEMQKGWELFSYDSNSEVAPFLLRRRNTDNWDKHQKWEFNTSSGKIPKGWEPFAYDSNDKFDPFILRRLTSGDWDEHQEWEIDRSSEEIPEGWKPFSHDDTDAFAPFLVCRRTTGNWDSNQKWEINASSGEIPEDWEPFAYDSNNEADPILLRRQIQ
jgi:hypothetical protein